MANQILVKNGDKGRLVKLLNTSFPTVADALNGKVTTSLHLRIRQAAIEMGGMEVKPEIKNGNEKS